jgi:hypothetical protein
MSELNQRIMIKSVKISFLVLLVLTSNVLFGKNSTIVNVKDCGAKGDGVADEYLAIQYAVGIINKNNGGTLYFPPGIYNIEAHHTKENGLSDVVFTGCRNLNILGNKAIVNVNGSFKRQSEFKKGNYYYSSTFGISPFSFKSCSIVNITGLEVTGNVDKMSRDNDVAESPSHLFKFYDCTNVTMRNVFVHHAQTDGIYINNHCRNFQFNNVRSIHNARQGISIIDLVDGKFVNCTFSFNGVTQGRYGGHLPCAGVDIEPSLSGRQTVENLLFTECTMAGNSGSQFICSQPSTTSRITIERCIIKELQSTSPYQIILSAKMVLMNDCKIELGLGDIYPLWGKFPGSEVRIVSCRINGSGKGILASSREKTNKLDLIGNCLVFSGKRLLNYFPYLQLSNLTFKNNIVSFHTSAITPNQVTSLVQGGSLSQGNVFRTESSQVKPKVSYKGTRVVNDKYE